MKLASYRCPVDQSGAASPARDGYLMVVSADLSRAVSAQAVAPSLQAALDDWARCEPRLQALYAALQSNTCAEAISFDEAQCLSPLPRAYQWADGSAYVNHVTLVRRARGAELPASFWHDPLMYQGGSDGFLAPHENIVLVDPAWGLDFEAEVAVITDDVPLGVEPRQALARVRLLMLVNDVSLRNLIPAELAKGFGFFQSKPASAFSPVAITPDELGARWRNGKVHLPLLSFINDKVFGRPNAGVDMTFDFGQLIAHAARTRSLAAGSIIGSGTVSNLQPLDHADAERGGVGYSCIAERRMIETLRYGESITPFLQRGDRVSIEMHDEQGVSIFGAIDQWVTGPNDH